MTNTQVSFEALDQQHKETVAEIYDNWFFEKINDAEFLEFVELAENKLTKARTLLTQRYFEG
jgi:hypothetical protein